MSEKVMESESIIMFKRHFDRYFSKDWRDPGIMWANEISWIGIKG